MAAKAGVYIQGLREITRSMERAGVDLDDLKDVMARVAAKATDVMQPLIPSRSGKLRGSARGNRAKAKATVTIGRGKTSRYAGVINYGWKARGIKPARFVARTDAVMETQSVQILEEGWADIVKRNGL